VEQEGVEIQPRARNLYEIRHPFTRQRNATRGPRGRQTKQYRLATGITDLIGVARGPEDADARCAQKRKPLGDLPIPET